MSKNWIERMYSNLQEMKSREKLLTLLDERARQYPGSCVVCSWEAYARFGEYPLCVTHLIAGYNLCEGKEQRQEVGWRRPRHVSRMEASLSFDNVVRCLEECCG